MSTVEYSSNQKAITIAISLLKRNNPKTIETLKNLLTFIPNPNHVNGVLKTAVVELVYSSPHSAYWLFQHPELLEPELQVQEIILTEVINTLVAWGCASDEVSITAEQRLQMDDAVLDRLRSQCATPADEAVLTLVILLMSGSDGKTGASGDC